MYDFPYPLKNSRNAYYSKYLYLIVADILRTDFSFCNANVIDWASKRYHFSKTYHYENNSSISSYVAQVNPLTANPTKWSNTLK